MSEGAFEAKLSAKRETSAGIYLTFQVEPADYTSDLATLRVGSSLMMGWSEVVNTKVEPIVVDPSDFGGVTDLMRGEKAIKERKPFPSLPLSQQAALRCQDNDFKLFICASNSEHAAEYVRKYCGVSSRSEIKAGENSGKDWVLLETKYQQWRTDHQYADAVR